MSSKSVAAVRGNKNFDFYVEGLWDFSVTFQLLIAVDAMYMISGIIRWFMGFDEHLLLMAAAFVSFIAGEMVVLYMWHKSLVRLHGMMPKKGEYAQ